MKNLFILTTAIASLSYCSAIWCYQCTSATPGCADNFNWRGIGYLGAPCPEDDDICVKIVEKNAVSETVTRGCISELRAFRTDMPPDHYEGCRQGAVDPHLSNYVFHDIKEHDIKRNYFSNTTFCFCFLDHRCNSGVNVQINWFIAILIGAKLVWSAL